MMDTLPQGWMTDEEIAWLVEQARGAERIIEVGVWKGRSTAAMAGATTGIIYAVDAWAGVPGCKKQHKKYLRKSGGDYSNVYREFCANLAPHIDDGRVVPVRMWSRDAARQLLETHGPVFDFVFIDGDHRYKTVLADIAAYTPLVRDGGILAGHDYANPGWPEVGRAVDRAIPHREQGPDRIWWTRITREAA